MDNNPFKELDLTSFQELPNLRKIDLLYCTGLERLFLKPIKDIDSVSNAKIDFSATAISDPPPLIIDRGLRAVVEYLTPNKVSSLSEIRLKFGLPGPEIKVDKCVLCKQPILELDRNVCPDCEDFYDDQG